MDFSLNKLNPFSHLPGAGDFFGGGGIDAETLKKVMEIFRQLEARQGQRYDAAQGYMGQIIPTLQKGFGDAKGELARTGATTRASIAQGAKRLQGASTANLVSRGLYNSSRATSESTGIERSKQASLADANSNLAQMLSSMDVSQAQAIAQALGGQANFLTGRSAAETGLGVEKAGTFAGAPRDKGLQIQDLLPLLGLLA